MLEAVVARAWPFALVALNLGAAMVELSRHNWPKAIYWASSALCVGVVAWL